MRRAHWHTFQVLTKRAERLEELSPKIDWPENVWMGVSIENQDYTYRIDHLCKTGAKTKFLSLEPLLGPLHKMNLKGINWAIVGGESGQARVRWTQPGSLIFGINVSARRFRFSSNNGAECKRRRQAESLRAELGMKCR